MNRISVARLGELLISQYNQDFNEVASEEKTEISIEDKGFLKMANEAVLNDGHYNLKLPFRKADVCMPNNRQIAEQRLQSLKRKMNKEEHMAEAERSVITYMQRRAFPAEIATLEMTPPRVHKGSKICRLDPVLDEGILRVGGRLHKSAMPEETKHPCILPKDSHVSILLLRHIHERCGHNGRNHMLSELRKKYWIVKGNSVARKVLSRCVVCRRARGKAGEQKMADLPLERILPDLPPFTTSAQL